MQSQRIDPIAGGVNYRVAAFARRDPDAPSFLCGAGVAMALLEELAKDDRRAGQGHDGENAGRVRPRST